MAAARSHEEPPSRGAGRVGRERSDRPDVLAVDAEALAARREHAQRGTTADGTRDDIGRGVEHVLGVVEHEEGVERTGPVERLDRGFALRR